MLYGDNDTSYRKNSEVMEDLVSMLTRHSASKYRLKAKSPYSALVKGTTMYERKTYLGYNLDKLNIENTVIITGRCPLRADADLECPVTLEDAIESLRLRELLEKNPIPTIFMYGDLNDEELSNICSERKVDEKIVKKAEEKSIEFRKRILPESVKYYEINSVKESLPIDVEHLKSRTKRIYRGREVKDGEEHPLQRAIANYGMKTILLPELDGHSGKNIAVFGEPDEICSIVVAEMVRDELGKNIGIGLIGQLPLPSLGYPIEGNIRMQCDEDRNRRIYLNENDSIIKDKLKDYRLTLVALQLSPLTTDEQLKEIGKSIDRNAGIDLLMEQINQFRKYL